MNRFSNLDLKKIKNGDNSPLGLIFKNNFTYCVNKIKIQQNCSESIAKDVFMDAIQVLRDKVVMGNFEHDNLRSFLLVAAKNKLRNKLKKDRRSISLDVSSVEQYVTYKQGLNHNEQTHLSKYQQNKVDCIMLARKRMGDACKKLLEMNFDKGYSLKELVNILGYSNYDSVKTMKSKCVKQLRKITAELMNKMAPNG